MNPLAPDPPYQKMYATLFNSVTDALRLMEKGSSAEAIALLKQAQQSTEEQYINIEEEEPPENLLRPFYSTGSTQL